MPAIFAKPVINPESPILNRSRKRRPAKLGKLDRRTWQGQLLRDTRAALLEHLGGKATPTQMAIIEQAAQLKLRLALFDLKHAEQGGEMTLHDTRTYLAWSNAYVRTVRELGLQPPKVKAADNWQDAVADLHEAGER
jgi:hypothetical protein